jgi:Ca2+-binding EF-hand superfamily protein
MSADEMEKEKDKLRMAFRIFDENRDKKVTKKELGHVLKRYKVHLY